MEFINILYNTVYRKSRYYFMELYKSKYNKLRFLHSNDEFSILANSFPKSGTHLLLQILMNLPGMTHHGSFLASMPSIPFRERSKDEQLKMIRRIIPGEIIPGHLFYDSLYENVLNSKKIIHYFIYRDPRDVIVSEVYYLSKMNPWHQLHKYFKELKTMEEKITFGILGFDNQHDPYDYNNISERFIKYKGWIFSKNVCAIKYEELLPEKRMLTLKEIAKYYKSGTDQNIEINNIINKMNKSINPKKSHTFRSGGTGAWKKEFSKKNKKVFKDVAGDLLIELGYETDYDW